MPRMPKILVTIHSVHRVKKRNANLQLAFLFYFTHALLRFFVSHENLPA